MGGARNVYVMFVSAVALTIGVVQCLTGRLHHGVEELGAGAFGLVLCGAIAFEDRRERRRRWLDWSGESPERSPRGETPRERRVVVGLAVLVTAGLLAFAAVDLRFWSILVLPAIAAVALFVVWPRLGPRA